MPLAYRRGDGAGGQAIGCKLAYVRQCGLLRWVRFQAGGAAGANLVEAERRRSADMSTALLLSAAPFRQTLLDPLPLEFCDQRQHPEKHAGDPVLRNRL